MTFTLPAPPEPSELRSKRGAGWQPDSTAENATRLGRMFWRTWRDDLRRSGLDQRHFTQIVMSYRSELWLWRAGERSWAHVVSGLVGRVGRRVQPPGTP